MLEPLVLGDSSNFGGWEIAPCFISLLFFWCSFLLLFKIEGSSSITVICLRRL